MQVLLREHCTREACRYPGQHLSGCRSLRVQGGLAGVMRLLEGDEFVRGILEPAGLCLADVERTTRAGTSYRTLYAPAPSSSSRLR